MKKEITVMMLVERSEDCHQELAVEGTVEYSVDIDYGSDADGNRGCRKVTVDDVTDVWASDEDGEIIELDKEDLELAKDNLVQKFLEE